VAEDLARIHEKQNKIFNFLTIYRDVCRQIFSVKILADCASTKYAFKCASLAYSKEMKEKLQLTSKQAKQAETALSKYKKELEGIYKNEFTNPSEVLQRINDASIQKMAEILNADQLNEWKKIDATYFYVMPQAETSEQLLNDLFEINGKAFLYAMRRYVINFLSPTWKSWVWDNARAEALKVYKSKDPIKKITRSWAILQQIGRLARMDRVPLVVNKKYYKVDSKKVRFGWDHELGEIEFTVGNLDGSRWALWKSFVEGKTNTNQISFTVEHKKGRPVMMLRIPYEKPAEKYERDENRSLEVNFDDEGIKIYMRDGKVVSAKGMPIDDVRKVSVDFVAAVSGIDAIKHRDEKLLAELRSCGSFSECRNGEGLPKAAKASQAKRRALSEFRSDRVREWNNRWARRIMSTARLWKCSRIFVFDVPESLKKRPWQWFNFKFKLSSDAKLCGCEIVFLTSPTVEDVVS
jgi:hypothetical protein